MIDVFRNEVKFVVYQHEFAKMRNNLRKVMRPDENAKGFEYSVRSLYFDTVYDRDLYDNIDGVLRKKKLRLRTYGDDTTVKLELKEKEGSLGRKQSLLLSREEAELMQKCKYDFLRKRTEPLATEIYITLLRGAYQPKTLIEYDREAYTYPVGKVRVTFDSNIRATASGWDIFSEKVPWTTITEKGTGVLEIKYSGMMPDFIKKYIGIDRLSTANSKYVKSRLFYQFGGNIK